MYKNVIRLINKKGLIVDSHISNLNSETLALKEALHNNIWILSDGDTITINKEWFDGNIGK